MKADPVQTNLSWRGEFAYLRKRMPSGRETWKSLGKLSKDDARRIVKQMVQRMSAEHLELQLGLITRQKNLATIGDVLAAYDRYAAGIEIEELTVRGCKNALQRVIRVVRGASVDVHGTSSAILTGNLITDYAAAMIASRKAAALAEKLDIEEREADLQAAQRTIRSTVQQARALFSAAALRSTPYREIDLPELKEFLEVQVGDSTVVAYEPPPIEVLARILADVPKLKQEDPAAWLAMMLELNAGLRRSSAVEARWDWFLDRGVDEKQGRLIYLAIRVAKGGKSLVRFDAGLYDEMKALRADLREYIVPGAAAAALQAAEEKERPAVDRKARQAVFDRLLAWLQARGLNERRCPNHELRKWFGDQKYIQHGAGEAQDALGHSTEKLTKLVYSQRRTKHALRIV